MVCGFLNARQYIATITENDTSVDEPWSSVIVSNKPCVYNPELTTNTNRSENNASILTEKGKLAFRITDVDFTALKPQQKIVVQTFVGNTLVPEGMYMSGRPHIAAGYVIIPLLDYVD